MAPEALNENVWAVWFEDKDVSHVADPGPVIWIIDDPPLRYVSDSDGLREQRRR